MKYFPLAVVLLTLACDSTGERIDRMKYFKDSKTDLCFAAQSLGFNNGVMTNVPCTPEVERLIKDGEK
jgi:hypothetical protein